MNSSRPHFDAGMVDPCVVDDDPSIVELVRGHVRELVGLVAYLLVLMAMILAMVATAEGGVRP